MTTTSVLVPITRWSNGHGVTHQVRRITYVHDPANAVASAGYRTLCGQPVKLLHPSEDPTSCKVCLAGAVNESALIATGRWEETGVPLAFPMPGTRLDGGIVVASVYSGADDNEVLVILLLDAEPYYRVAEFSLETGECLLRASHPNIVPAVREYIERGGDY